MHRVGTVQRFDPDRGFGFLHSPQSSADVFFHVRDFDRRHGPPTVGMAVAFEEIHVGAKGPRAMAVRPVDLAPASGPSRPPRPTQPPVAPPARDRRSAPGAPSANVSVVWAALALQLGLLAVGLVQGAVPAIALVTLPALNLLTFWLYWHDKHAAQRGAWRVQENTLHALALAGGWPAAWWAQQLLRHKSRKPAFRQTYWATVVGHLALLASWMAWRAWPALH